MTLVQNSCLVVIFASYVGRNQIIWRTSRSLMKDTMQVCLNTELWNSCSNMSVRFKKKKRTAVCLDPMCLWVVTVGEAVACWPWPQHKVAALPHMCADIFGWMLLMSECCWCLLGISSWWMLSLVSFKTSHQMKPLEMTHMSLKPGRVSWQHLDRCKTGC